MDARTFNTHDQDGLFLLPLLYVERAGCECCDKKVWMLTLAWLCWGVQFTTGVFPPPEDEDHEAP